eukprot:comp7314_c0_seq1/m.3013 comp7314_c0_seq1/g.3013  ORF comp7314_c0_seq1/g.3013 comp7314_c0_seq1/m.3013 type:complete len:364 (-) comp7314_c0_seq1:24-1115(-)
MLTLAFVSACLLLGVASALPATNQTTNWAEKYYPNVPMTPPLTVIPMFPTPLPHDFGVPFPSCDSYTPKGSFGRLLDAKSNSPRLNNAYISAYLSWMIYYMPQVQVHTWLECLGARRILYVDTARHNQAMVVAFNEGVVIVMQGTISEPLQSDWISNLDTWLTRTTLYGPGENILVHRGFHTGFVDILKSGGLESAISSACSATEGSPSIENCNLFTTGHSRGGAFAVLAGAWAAAKNYKVRGVYTYGCPRVGNEDFRELYDVNLGLGRKTLRGVNKLDAVAEIPVAGIPWGRVLPVTYKHVGGNLFATDMCGPTDLPRICVNPVDHYPHMYVTGLWATCSRDLSRDQLPPPPFPNGAWGMYL